MRKMRRMPRRVCERVERSQLLVITYSFAYQRQAFGVFVSWAGHVFRLESQSACEGRPREVEEVCLRCSQRLDWRVTLRESEHVIVRQPRETELMCSQLMLHTQSEMVSCSGSSHRVHVRGGPGR